MTDRKKILVAVTEDWFAVSHFLPLFRFLKSQAENVVVLTRISTHRGTLEGLGLRVRNFDFKRSVLSLSDLRVAHEFRSVVEDEAPDILHSIAMKPVGLACAFLPPNQPMVLHVTGLGHLVDSQAITAKTARGLIFNRIARRARSKISPIIVENTDDAAVFRNLQGVPHDAVTVVPGAALSSAEITRQERRWAPVPPVRCIYAGRMIASKGIDVLVDGARAARDQGADVTLELFGDVDEGNPQTCQQEQLKAWQRDHDWLTWHGRVADRSAIWGEPGIAIQPTLTREGMPRAMLEAAAYRQVIVASDVPGCRDFVTHRVNGLLCRPGDSSAISSAICEILEDRDTAAMWSQRAYDMVCTNFSEEALIRQLEQVYASL